MPRITTIPATKPLHSTTTTISGQQLRRVAGYARVSTDDTDQANSYEAQVDYYEHYIKNHDGWQYVDIYTDEGISGTSTKHREGFTRMIADALSGKIDLIVTKSVSRFARNTVDSLTTVRKLKDKGVEVFFEKENILDTRLQRRTANHHHELPRPGRIQIYLRERHVGSQEAFPRRKSLYTLR